MASVIDTTTLGKKADEVAEKMSGGGSGRKSNYIKLDKKVRIRPVGNIFEVYKFFVKRKDGSARSVCVKASDVEEASRILSEAAGYDVTPQNRFAMNAIDRADGEFKILENGISIFGTFGQWSASQNGIHPGGKDGWDWDIIPKGTGFNRKYTTLPVKAALLTPEEKARIKNGEAYDIEEIYKETPLDKILDRVFGERQNSEPEPDPVSSEVASDDDDDLLGTNKKAKW